MWVHLFPSRTQKLSTCTPTILGGRLPGKIGNANTRESGEILTLSFLLAAKLLSLRASAHAGVAIYSTQKLSTCTPVAVPCVRLVDRAAALHTDRSHSLRLLYPPPAALPSLPDNTWRAPVVVPGECPRLQCTFVPRRPLPLAHLAFSATGSAQFAPPGR